VLEIFDGTRREPSNGAKAKDSLSIVKALDKTLQLQLQFLRDDSDSRDEYYRNTSLMYEAHELYWKGDPDLNEIVIKSTRGCAFGKPDLFRQCLHNRSMRNRGFCVRYSG
jgi:hypothetical protein